MTTDQISTRVKEIIKEYEMNWTLEKEMEMSVAYAQARADFAKEELEAITKRSK